MKFRKTKTIRTDSASYFYFDFFTKNKTSVAFNAIHILSRGSK